MTQYRLTAADIVYSGESLEADAFLSDDDRAIMLAAQSPLVKYMFAPAHPTCEPTNLVEQQYVNSTRTVI